MTRTSQFILIVTLTITSQRVFAQAPDQPGMIVFHQNMVDEADVEALNAIQDSLITPVFNELVDEELLMGWGQLMHAWGDEWNYNFYFSVEDHRGFLDFWDEFIRRMNERHPGWFEKLAPLLRAHKDNFYSVRTMR